MKKIPLTKGQFALVDNDDHDYINQWKWHYKWGKHGGYAVRTGNPPKKQRIYMHHLVLEKRQDVVIDHIDRNGLNNCRNNLRYSTRSQNNMNRIKSGIGFSSKYKGVSWHKGAKKWMAKIKVNRKLKYLGCYTDEAVAAATYNVAARRYYGEFAVFNLIQGENHDGQ